MAASVREWQADVIHKCFRVEEEEEEEEVVFTRNRGGSALEVKEVACVLLSCTSVFIVATGA